MNKIYLLSVFIFLSLKNFGGTPNIASEATVAVSSSLNNTTGGNQVNDGIIGIDGKGEWACEGVTTDWGYIRFPWLEMKWKRTRNIDRIVIYDRASETENIAGGKLVFSDGSEIWVNQIPADGTGKLIRFTAKKINWIKFVVTDGTGRDLGLSEMEVFASPEENIDISSWVDPYIETNRGRYFFFVTGSLPFGMASAAPHTRNKNQNGGGYNYNEKEVLGFGQIHDWMMSGIEVMPGSQLDDPGKGNQDWKSPFSHDDEIVRPGYHRLFLQKNKIWTELTSTDRVSFYRFTYTKDTKARIIINLSGHLSNASMENARIRRLGDTAIEGSVSTTNRYWGGPRDVKLFFTIRFDKKMKALESWKQMKYQADTDSIDGDSVTLAAAFDLKRGEQVQMKIGLSYTTIENARNNLEKECAHWNFTEVKNSANDIWNEWLGRIQVKGGSTEQKIKFYTDLWHVLLGRHKTNDISGDYPDRTTGKREGSFTDAVFKIKKIPTDSTGVPRFNMYNSDAWWLTHWNLNILWGLAWPEVADDFSASMIEYANNGGLLPRGPSGGGYSYIMTSCPATNLIVSTYMKGLLTKADPEHSFNVIKRNHLPGGMLGTSDEINFYTNKGWWPGNAGITIEAAFQDWGIAQMAGKLGKKKDEQFFLKRSQSWKNIFHPEKKLLFPKDKNGKFIHQDPLSGEGWVEANAWQATWGVSHAIAELVKMMGGTDTFCNRLNHAFEQSRKNDFVFGYTEGYVSYANQPGCSNAHVFNAAGKPWLSQYWVRRVKEQAYGGITPDLGYGGHDEDQGQMGGVSALMAIGLFDIRGNQSSTPVYEITSPVFEEIEIKLDPRYYTGKRFVIRTYGNGPENDYIQQAKINGSEHRKYWFTHETFSKGGLLELWLGPQPNKKWGTED